MVGEKVPEQPQFGIWRQIGPSGNGRTPDETAHQQLLAPRSGLEPRICGLTVSGNDRFGS